MAMFGAPEGIKAREEGNRAAMLGGLNAVKLMGDIAQQPIDAQHKQALGRLYEAQAADKEATLAAERRMAEIQAEFVARQELVEGKRSTGEVATVNDLPKDGKLANRSQAADLQAFADFAKGKGAPPKAMAELNKTIAGILKDEAAGRSSEASATKAQTETQLKKFEAIGNYASAAAETPQNYMAIMSNPELRAQLPPQLTGDFNQDRPVLKAIAAASQDAIKRAELELKREDEKSKLKTRDAARAASQAAVSLAKVRIDQAKFDLATSKKYDGPQAEATLKATKELAQRRQELTKANNAKAYPPLTLNPADREIGQIYTLKDGRRARWEVNPATGDPGMNVLSAADAPDQLVDPADVGE